MLTYNNHLKPLVLPEYGRNIQNMVDYCLTIEDREERTRCANTIVTAMYTLFPPAQGTDPAEYRRKLWDQVAMMSDFRLDVDVPFELVRPDVFGTLPDPVATAYPRDFRFRHYGLYVQQLIETAAAMEESEARDALVYLIANHMKKLQLAVNKDGVEDEKIFKDLRMMSHGAINPDPATVRLHDFKIAPTPAGKKKKK